MNFYERHLGDYLKDTAHLTLLEHGVYTRLLDVYYTREGGIPEQEAARLIGARTRDERAALGRVLREFFELVDGVWRQGRADKEIAAYRDGEPEREVKKANETNRLKRHREERAELFKVITATGAHAAWNAPMAELRELAKRCSQPLQEPGLETAPATAPATPATATQSPVPSPQSPLLLTSFGGDSGSALSAAPPPPPPAFDGRNGEALNGKAVVPLAAGFELPEDWGTDAEALGFRPSDVLRESERYRQYWVAGRGQGTRRSVKGWRQAWSNWLAKAAERPQR